LSFPEVILRRNLEPSSGVQGSRASPEPILPISLPDLRPEYEPTRATLHAYARAAGAIPRAYGIPQPRWWHISLKVRPGGLLTDPIPTPDGRALAVLLDLTHHRVVLHPSRGERTEMDLRAGATATEIGDRLVSAVAGLGLEGGVERDRYADDEPRSYDPAAAAAYFTAFVAVHGVLEQHRSTLGNRVSPIQVWPHGFDLAFDAFGTRMVDHDGAPLPAQLNLGFYPGGEPYFYSNPWPFDPDLVSAELPPGAEWHAEGWQGSLLPYTAVRADPDPGARLLEYARRVHTLVAPMLAGD
jgi:hypothetical protein